MIFKVYVKQYEYGDWFGSKAVLIHYIVKHKNLIEICVWIVIIVQKHFVVVVVILKWKF